MVSVNIFDEIQMDVPHILISTLGCAVSCINKKVIDPSLVKLFIIEETLSLISSSMTEDKRCSNIFKITNVNSDSQYIFFTSSFSKDDFDPAINRSRIENIITLDLLDKKELFKNILNFIVISNFKDRYSALVTVLNNTKFKKVIINVNGFKVNRYLSERLKNDFYKVYSLQTEVGHNDRKRTLFNFIKADAGILISCYPLSLNVELEEIQMVINYDSNSLKDCYYQKISHLGRFDKLGFAINIIREDSNMRNEIEIIKRDLGIKFINFYLSELPLDKIV